MIRLGFGWAGILAALCLVARLGECTTDQSSFSADYSDCEEDTSLIADGICDAATNTAACNYDGGDCCECTCFLGGVLCDKTENGFSCEDPDAPTDCGPTANATPSPMTPVEQSECAGYVPHIGDGYCDEANNNAACGFDGGDCCACTCGEDVEHPCGVEGVGFDCQDPDVPLDCSLSLPGCGGDAESIQNSFCDSTLNNEECGYDGGDCCECTCREYDSYDSCGYYGYDCIDPSAPRDCDTDSPTPSPTSAYPGCESSYVSYIADGDCDSSLNSLECGWDGGDCCRCTCTPGSYSCTSFNCLDPSAATDCATDSPASSPYGSYVVSQSPTTSLSDDTQVTDSPAEDTISRGSSSTGDDDGCQEPVSLISDGLCHVSANTELCGWDGGDCCESTCVDGRFSCGEVGYSCQDPAGGADYPQPTAAPASEQAGLEYTPTTDTSLTSAEVGGAVSIAAFGFVSIAVLIIGGLLLIRRKCQACVG